jgi:hypothetical protein
MKRRETNRKWFRDWSVWSAEGGSRVVFASFPLIEVERARGGGEKLK